MTLLRRFLAWTRRWTRGGPTPQRGLPAAGAALPPPPVLPEIVRNAQDEATGQEWNESRERILSRIMAWRIEQCRRELQSPFPRPDSATFIAFPSLTEPRARLQPHR